MDWSSLSQQVAHTTYGFTKHVQLLADSASDTAFAISVTTAYSTRLTCNVTRRGQTNDGVIVSRAVQTRAGQAYQVAFESAAFLPLTEYDVACRTAAGFPSATRAKTKKASGIVGDPHVLAGDGAVLDFFGAAARYLLYTSPRVTLTGRLGLASRGPRALFHPSALQLGTLLVEARVAVGDVQLRLAAHGGGLVSVSAPKLQTVFWRAGENAKLELGAVTVTWTRVDETQAFPWGTHRRSQALRVATPSEAVRIFVAASPGVSSFLDAHVLVDGVDGVGSGSGSGGLLHDALFAPDELRARLGRRQEAHYALAATALP